MLSLILLGLHGCGAGEAGYWYNKGVRDQSIDSKISHYTKAIELEPNYAKAFYNRGIMANTTGRSETIPRPSGSSPIMPGPLTTGALPIARRVSITKT